MLQTASMHANAVVNMPDSPVPTEAAARGRNKAWHSPAFEAKRVEGVARAKARRDMLKNMHELGAMATQHIMGLYERGELTKTEMFIVWQTCLKYQIPIPSDKAPKRDSAKTIAEALNNVEE